MIQTVWKVAMRLGDERLVSIAAIGKHEIEYVPGVTIRAPHMFVFSDLNAAVTFNKSPSGEIWIARTETLHRAPERIVPATHLDETYNEFWDNPQLFALRRSTVGTPMHTWLCDDLLLVERVR